MNRISTRFVGLLISSLIPFYSACDWNDHYSDKAFLTTKYVLADCADINGQDPLQFVHFSQYKGVSYASLFSKDVDQTFLDTRVEIREGRAVGLGHILITMKTGVVFQDWYFEYWCSAEYNNYQGHVYASDCPDNYGDWVYSIYWCRLTIPFTLPEAKEIVNLTFNFTNGDANPTPSEFSGHDEPR